MFCDNTGTACGRHIIGAQGHENCRGQQPERQTFAATGSYMAPLPASRHYDCADCDRIDMNAREVKMHYILTGHFTKA